MRVELDTDQRHDDTFVAVGDVGEIGITVSGDEDLSIVTNEAKVRLIANLASLSGGEGLESALEPLQLRGGRLSAVILVR